MRDYSNCSRPTVSRRFLSIAYPARRSQTAVQLFFPRIAPHQFALCNYMIFHRRIELAALCAEGQIQLAVERENLEVITMRAGGRTRSAITGLAEIVCSLHSFWRASFSNGAGLRRDVPNSPMREQSAGRVRIIDDQDKAFRSRRNIRNLQRRAGVSAIA